MNIPLHHMRNLSKLFALFALFGFFSVHVEAADAYPELLFRHDHHLFAVQSTAAWRKTEKVWLYNGTEISVQQDDVIGLPVGLKKSERTMWNEESIAKALDEQIASTFDRSRGEVTISKEDGAVVFDGVGLIGRSVDIDHATKLTIEALEARVHDIHLPVTLEQPRIDVLDAELRDQGIYEVISIGESDYSGSPLARKSNIATGLSKFNGHVIPQGETFSFNQTLGPVNASTGYQKELVILGEKTLPEYGGGLCQVSTTAYRGLWEYGFPIAARRNHSFAVRYYSPQGTDATIYPPYTDMKFVNDSPGSILIQTYHEEDHAYFIYYGRQDNRDSEVIGPYVWDAKPPPPDRVEYTKEIPVGTERIAGRAVPGMQAAWFRVINVAEEETVEPFYSFYEARPNFTQIGDAGDVPSWIGEG